MRLAGGLVVAGAAMMLAKGVLLILTGDDRSLVPWFGLLASAGFGLAAIVLSRTADRWRWLTWLGGTGAAVGFLSSVVAVLYLVTGTIPESPGASDLVGFSYGVSSAGVAVALLSLGIVIVANRSLSGFWRWLPICLIVVQLPIFIVAGAVGDGVGSEDLTDGLGLALTGALWMWLGYAIREKQQLVLDTRS
ncbi:MAG TPA: hypothetical protein VMM14_00745 [Acidimicrobiia bacterium]|nr:hypothetical protein [Acidimicrobiia bacterium]